MKNITLIIIALITLISCSRNSDETQTYAFNLKLNGNTFNGTSTYFKLNPFPQYPNNKNELVASNSKQNFIISISNLHDNGTANLCDPSLQGSCGLANGDLVININQSSDIFFSWRGKVIRSGNSVQIDAVDFNSKATLTGNITWK